MSIRRVCDRCGADAIYQSGPLAVSRPVTVPVQAPYTIGAPAIPTGDFQSTVAFTFIQNDLCEPCARGAIIALARTFHTTGIDELNVSIQQLKAVQSALQAAASPSVGTVTP